MRTLQVDVYSDLICPWCFVGKRRLDRVLADLPITVSLRWRAYQLRPGLPLQGLDRVAYLKARYGEDADPGRIPGRLAAEADEEQVAFAYDRVARVPNTLLGHRLMAAAEPLGLQHTLAEALFEAYFQQGVDVGDQQALAKVGQNVGMSAEQTDDALRNPRWQEAVSADLEAGREHDVSGVPCLIFAERFPLPGVQDADTLRHFISRAAQRLSD